MGKPRDSTTVSAERHAPGRAFARVSWPYLAAGILLASAIVLFGADIAHHADAIETWVQQHQPWSLLGFIAIFVVATSLLFPESVLSILAGALFGLVWGILVVAVSSLLAAGLQYTVGRRLFRDRTALILTRKPSLQAIRSVVTGGDLRLQLLLRLTPLNPAMVSYVLGAAEVRFREFALASLALIPHAVLEVWFGYAGRHVARLAGSHSHSAEAHDVAIFGGLVAVVIAMTIIARRARRALLDAAPSARVTGN